MKFTANLHRLLAAAYRKTDEWLRKAGLAPDLSKRELMHYSRRKKDGTPAIRLQEHDGTISTITVFSHVKWLGVYLDRKLSFDHHVKILAGRAESAVNGLMMLANTVRGLSQVHLRHLYRACVLPVMQYASALWWTGRKKHEKLLEKAQRKALQLICAAFRTSPINALQIEASIFGAMGAAHITSQNANITDIHFFADNSAAINAIFDPKPGPGQLYAHCFHKIVCEFLDADPQHKVEI